MRVIKGARSFRLVGLSGSRTEISRYGDCMDTSSAWQDELVVGSRNKKVRLVTVLCNKGYAYAKLVWLCDSRVDVLPRQAS